MSDAGELQKQKRAHGAGERERMVTELEVRTLLKNEIASKADLPLESIDDNGHLADMGIDSLQALQLLVLLERSYGITLDDNDLQHFRNINSLVALVTSRVQAIPAIQN
jgi:acyl carrier protein